MKAPIKHDRCIVTGIKVDDKNFSTLLQQNKDYKVNLKINHSV